MGKKKFMKAEQKYTAKQLDLLEKFNMGPGLDISKKDAEILDAVAEAENVSFFTLCDLFDEKPSKINKRVEKLRSKELIDYSETEKIICLTPVAARFLGCKLEDSKADKKFRKFVESLDDEEIDRFIALVDQFKIDETLNAPADEEENKEEKAEECEEPEAAECGEPAEEKAEEEKAE